MSWLTKVRNSIPFLPKRETPDNLWHKCPECEAMVFSKEYEENLYVCPRCDHHGRIGPTLRFELLMDPGYTVLPPPQVREDPLKFRDSKRYSERIKAARAATGEPDALINARGAVDGHRVVLGVQDFAFMGGSMGMAVGAAFVAGARAAIADRAPYVIVTAAGGARMQEGILSLMQMPKATVAVAELKEAGLPYIVILADPTTGGVTASYAMLGDVHVAEPGALIGFAGQRVIESTIREKLPEGFQRAEYL
ncbi:MAG: acetyl-CoA carboxylase carboxyl transferase subunit beta, partial [Sphingomonadales bacterium]|nr:acetyl-CoA carboxylase carboxyl transferase subunit beta [Sphingomonadales bacterium]